VIESGGRQPVDGIHGSEEGVNPVFIGKVRVNKKGETGFKDVSEFSLRKTILW